MMMMASSPGEVEVDGESKEDEDCEMPFEVAIVCGLVGRLSVKDSSICAAVSTVGGVAAATGRLRGSETLTVTSSTGFGGGFRCGSSRPSGVDAQDDGRCRSDAVTSTISALLATGDARFCVDVQLLMDLSTELRSSAGVDA